MREVVIVDACRSPVGRAGDRGVYRAFTGRDIMKPVIKAIIARNKLDPNMIDDVTLGSATGGWGGRIQAMIAELPWSVGGSSIERACGSSSTAIAIAATSILNGDADIMLALGLETMDRNTVVQPWQVGQRGAPQGFARGGAGLTPEQAAAKYPEGWKTGADLISPLPPHTPPWFMNMGMTAEELAKRYNIPKTDMDEFSVRSHMLATKAQDDGIFKDEIIPITLKYTDSTYEVISQDQIPRRDTTLEKVAALKPSFTDDGVITAGNSSPRSDGAGAVLLMSKDMAKKLKMFMWKGNLPVEGC